MKKIISIIAFVAFFATNSFSEENFKLGVRAGYSNSFSKDRGLGLGVGGGVTASIPIASFLSFNPELNLLYKMLWFYYTRSGDCPSEMLAGMPPGMPKPACNYQYMEYEFAISIPLMFQITPFETLPLYFALGAQADIPFLPREMRFAYGDPENRTLHGRSNFDLGIALGLGYNITEKIAADLRYVIGLTKFTDKEKAGRNNSIEKEDKKSFHQFGLGFNYFF